MLYEVLTSGQARVRLQDPVGRLGQAPLDLREGERRGRRQRRVVLRRVAPVAEEQHAGQALVLAAQESYNFV